MQNNNIISRAFNWMTQIIRNQSKGKSQMKCAITNLTMEEFNIGMNAINAMGSTAATVSETPVAEATPPSTTQGAETPPPSTTAAVDVPRDSAGVPWDAQIHSGKSAVTSTPKADGTWKRKKGIDDALYETVTKELLLNIPASLDRTGEASAVGGQPVAGTPVDTNGAELPPVQQAAPVVAQVPAPVVAQVPAPVVAQVPAPVVAQVPAPVVAQVPAPITPTEGPNVAALIITAQQHQCRMDIPHETMMNQLNIALQDPNNIVTATDIPAICVAFGINSLPDCINNPEMIGKIYYIIGGQ